LAQVVRQLSPCEVVSPFSYGMDPRRLIGAKHNFGADLGWTQAHSTVVPIFILTTYSLREFIYAGSAFL